MSREQRRRSRRRVGTRARPARSTSRQPRRRRGQRWVRWVYSGLAVAIGLSLVLSLVIVRSTGGGRTLSRGGPDLPGTAVSLQGEEHIDPGETHPPYNSIPPTSGWHYATSAEWGIHKTPIQDELQVHNLEHGGVLIQYNTEDQAVIQQLEQVAQSIEGFPCYAIVAPYPSMSSTIALTAWGVIDTLEQVDEARIGAFVDAYLNRGPERVPCP